MIFYTYIIFVIFSFFTLIGSRTIDFQNDYEVHLTCDQNSLPSTATLLDLHFVGKISTETFNETIPLNFREKSIVFPVSDLFIISPYQPYQVNSR